MLESGSKVIDGPTEETVTQYLSKIMSEHEAANTWQEEWNLPEYRASFRIEKVEITRKDGIPAAVFSSDEEICIRIKYHVFKSFPSVRFSIHLNTVEAILVMATTDADTLSSFGHSREPGVFVSRCWIPRNLLSPTDYLIHLGAYLPTNQLISGAENVSSFKVVETSGPIVPKMHGVVSPLLKWEMEKVRDG